MKPSQSWLLTAAAKCFPGKIQLYQMHKSSYGKHGWKLTAVRHSKWCWSFDTSTLTCHSRMERKERITCLNIQTAISLNSCSWSVFIRQWDEIKQTNKNRITLKGGQTGTAIPVRFCYWHIALYKSLCVVLWLLVKSSCPTLVCRIMAFWASLGLWVTYMEKRNEGCRWNSSY